MIKKFARWLYTIMYNDELIILAIKLRSGKMPPNEIIGMLDALETLDLLIDD